MSQATRPNDRHIIWSNQNLDVDDWREDYKEFLEANELDDDPNDEQALYEWMEETNYDYLSDERVNLNVQLSQPIIVPFPVSWTVKMKKKQKETQDILSYHTQAAGCSDKARAKASGGRQPIEECGRTGL